MRGLPQQVITALNSDELRIADLLKIEFDTPVYLTNYIHNVIWDANTYVASSHVISLSDPSETRDLRVNSISVELSGVEQSFISIFLSGNWVNKSVRMMKALMSEDGTIIGEPIVTFDGIISQFQIAESNSSCSVNMNVSSHWSDFEKKAGRKTNNNSQQFYFPLDQAMEFSANTVKDIKWGRA